MKKKSILGIICVFMFSAVAVNAEGLKLDNIEAEPKNVAKRELDNFRLDYSTEKSMLDLGSTDIVEIDENGLFHVQTQKLTTTLLPPFGSICITQDLGLQLSEYISLYKDPLKAAQDMLYYNCHYTIWSADYRVVTDIDINEEDRLGEIIKESTLLDEKDEASVCQYIHSEYYPDASSIAPITIGNHRYYKILYMVDGNIDTAIYSTFVNGCCIDIMSFAIDDTNLTETDMEDIEYLIGDFNAQAL